MFTFGGSTHELSFAIDRPVDSVVLDMPGVGIVPAEFSTETGRWTAVVAAPDADPWSVTVVATRNGADATSAPALIPVVPDRSPELPVTMSDNTSTRMSLIEWGDGPTSVGLESPVEGEVQSPSGVAWVESTSELVVVDRVNERLMVTDPTGHPIRTIPLAVEGWLTDVVLLPDDQLLVAEIRRDNGSIFTVGHVVKLATGVAQTTDPVEIPRAPGSLSLRYDDPSGLVFADFGDLYPYYDTHTDTLIASATPGSGWHGRITGERQAGIDSGPSFLAATFPGQPAIEDTDTTPTAAWALVAASGEGAEVFTWLSRYPFDGSPITATAVPYPRLLQANNVFAVRPHDVVLMVKSDAGLELHSIPIT